MKTVLIIVSLFALAAVAGAIYVGSKSFDGTVTEKPYETGLAWDRTLKEKAATGWEVSIEDSRLQTGDTDLFLSITDSHQTALKDAVVTVKLGRPGSASLDRTYNASMGMGDRYMVKVNFPAYGHWDATISVTKDNKRVSFNKKLYIENGGVK